jgi:CDP-diacylglycerol--serine O-phosphatidyltransferase
MFARILDARSMLGKQLDSLADVVSFGVVPGLILFSLLENTPQHTWLVEKGYPFITYLAFLVPLFSALRLARFNIDDRQTSVFLGLPTPAVAILVGSLPLILHYSDNVFLTGIAGNFYFLLCLVIFTSVMMLAPIPMLSLKLKNFTLRDNLPVFLLFILGLFMVLLLKVAAIPMIILLYILLSLVLYNKLRSFADH